MRFSLYFYIVQVIMFSIGSTEIQKLVALEYWKLLLQKLTS